MTKNVGESRKLNMMLFFAVMISFSNVFVKHIFYHVYSMVNSLLLKYKMHTIIVPKLF